MALTTPEPPRAKRRRGVALVAVLLGLGALSSIAVTVGSTARSHVDLARNHLAAARAEALADGAIRLAIAVWLANPEAWIADGTPHPVSLAGAAVRVEIQDINGLLDLNTADADLLAGWLAGVGAANPGGLARQIVQWRSPDASAGQPNGRTFELVEEVALVPGFPAALMPLALRDLTVFSRRPGIDPLTAPLSVLRAVPGFDPGEAAAWSRRRLPGAPLPQADSPLARRYFLPGKPQVLRVIARTEFSPHIYREAVIRLTGDPVEPFWTHLWRSRTD